MDTLSSKEKAQLRSIAQRLKPAVHVGKNGLSYSTQSELRRVFEKEELVKVSFKADRTQMAGLVAEVERATGSQCVGGVGKRRSFYRQLPEQDSDV